MAKTIYHKHDGVESKGKLKSHPITAKHKAPKAIKAHNALTQRLGRMTRSSKPAVVSKGKKTTKATPKSIKELFGDRKEEPEEVVSDSKKVMLTVDDEDYISMDLDKCGHKGLRLTFTRKDANKKLKREVALQIENIPFVLPSGQHLKGNRKLTVNINK